MAKVDLERGVLSKFPTRICSSPLPSFHHLSRSFICSPFPDLFPLPFGLFQFHFSLSLSFSFDIASVEWIHDHLRNVNNVVVSFSKGQKGNRKAKTARKEREGGIGKRRETKKEGIHQREKRQKKGLRKRRPHKWARLVFTVPRPCLVCLF